MDRFAVHYRVFAGSRQEARDRAEGIALEQTVEIPDVIVPSGFIRDTIIGQIGEIVESGPGIYDVAVSYSPDSAGNDIVQLLNVIFGNSSIQKGIKVTRLVPGATIAARFKGPRFGIAGVRERAGRPFGGLISPVIKPMGSTADELAQIAYRCALGGADIVKDDHGLANQDMAPFRERVEKVAAAVARANAETGGSSLYFPNLAGSGGELVANAHFAKDCGAGGVLLMPGLHGFSAVRELADDDDFALPIMTHPSFLGPYVLSEDTGFTHAMMFGVLQRLAGSDISVFPNVGGRFGFSSEECLSIADACRDPEGLGKPMLPSPGGGMSVERAGDMVSMYGEDVVYLLGGSLLRYGDRIADGVRAMRQAVHAG